ncbi:hypothetical protein L1887_12033 [Cichorium endivia]|nr:hypothetical protein L1887_12033 [Cichorium endivia]
MATGAAAMMLHCVFEGSLSMSEIDKERRPYHKNCSCALHRPKDETPTTCFHHTRISYVISSDLEGSDELLYFQCENLAQVLAFVICSALLTNVIMDIAYKTCKVQSLPLMESWCIGAYAMYDSLTTHSSQCKKDNSQGITTLMTSFRFLGNYVRLKPGRAFKTKHKWAPERLQEYVIVFLKEAYQYCVKSSKSGDHTINTAAANALHTPEDETPTACFHNMRIHTGRNHHGTIIHCRKLVSQSPFILFFKVGSQIERQRSL